MIFILVVFVAIFSAFVGARMAKSRKRDPAIWAVICFLVPLVGILALAIAGNSSLDSQNQGSFSDYENKWRILL
jgi:hypothetical protein